MIARIILWISVIWLVPIMYFMLKNETKFKKNIAVGVTLPYDGRIDPEVLSRLDQFKRELRWVCLGLLVLAAVNIALPVGFGASLTLFLIWVDLCIVLPYVPYIQCNWDLKQIKAERGWKRQTAQNVAIVLSVAARAFPELSLLHFVPPSLISMIPTVYEFVRGEVFTGVVLLIDTACIALFYVLYRWAFRRKAEVVDENTDLNAALTRLRRQAWRRCWLWASWLMGFLNIGVWLSLYRGWLGIIVLALLTVALVAVMFHLEFSMRRAQERLTQDSGRSFYVDEDDKWLYGIFYYDPNDSRMIVNARVGINTTVNLAKKGSWMLLGAVAVLLLMLPLMGVRLMQEEHSPVTLELTDTALMASHSHSAYAVQLDEIGEIELLAELPSMTRTMGTAMESVLKGRYRSGELGNLNACLDPRTGPYLLIRTVDGTLYLFGDSQEGKIQTIYQKWERVR